jgi:hypothetical protein
LGPWTTILSEQMRIDIPCNEEDLKKDHARGPHCRATPEPRQDVFPD